MRAPFTPEPRRTWRFRRSALLPEPIPNAHDGGDHVCVSLTPTDFYLVLVASGKAAEYGLTLPAIRAWYADGLPDAPRRARSDLCATCPLRIPDTHVVTATPAAPDPDADAIAVPNWPTHHTPIDRPKGENA